MHRNDPNSLLERYSGKWLKCADKNKGIPHSRRIVMGGDGMRVYCDRVECKNCKDGICKNRFPTGEEAIKLHENWMGEFICTDFVEEADEDE